MAVDDPDVAVGRDRDAGRTVEAVGSVARDAGRTERHQELAVGAEFEHLMALADLEARLAAAVADGRAFGHPDIAFAVDVEAVRKGEQSFAEALHEIAGEIEFQDRIGGRAGAIVSAAARENPDVLAVAVGKHAARDAELHAFGQLLPAIGGAIRIWRIALRETLLPRKTGQRNGQKHRCHRASVHVTSLRGLQFQRAEIARQFEIAAAAFDFRRALPVDGPAARAAVELLIVEQRLDPPCPLAARAAAR